MTTMYPRDLCAVKGWLYALMTLLLLACSGADEPPQTDAPKPAPYLETGDLDSLRKHNTIRLIFPHRESDRTLPRRQALPIHTYRDMAVEFVEQLGLEPLWVAADSFDQAIADLKQGRGDIIVANLTHTASREQQVAFTLPLSRAKEHIVTAASAAPVKSLEDLRNKTIAVSAGSSFAESLQKIIDQQPDLDIRIKRLQQASNPDKLLDQLNAGDFFATVLDDNIARELAAYRDDFRISIPISELRNIAWAVRSDATELLHRLNQFITRTLATRDRKQRYTDGLTAIKARKTLRMITQNTPTSYFLWRGELMGFEYDLMKQFADRQQLKLEVIVAPPQADMIEWLKHGRGDVIAAAMTILPQRQQRGVTFTRPYNFVGEQLVTSTGRAPFNNLQDLNGRALVIRTNTAYWQTALAWREQGYQFDLIAAPDDMDTADILAAVAQGSYDATLADSHLVAIEQSFHDSLVPGFIQEPRRKHGWAVRDSNPELLRALNDFLKKNYKSRLFNITYNKYFKNQRRIDKYQGQRLNHDDALSPYDELVKTLASHYQLDWRLVVAQMYQESRFNPGARSFAGAQGLLQVLPRTAREMGFTLPLNEEKGILAGIRYLDWTRQRFEQTLPLAERLWFSLAAYNAGYGHVYDARRLAARQGWDPDVWFDNVERAMLLLGKREYASKARFGYVRGREPVNYVRNIRDRYYAYLAL